MTSSTKALLKVKGELLVTLLVMLLAGCATVVIPPEKQAWADSVRDQISSATASHYVYVQVTDEQERKILEHLAFKSGKQTQRIKQNGKIIECVFVHDPEFYR